MVLRKKTGLRELALFAGAGGGILGGMLLGWRTVAAVEIEDYPRAVLLQRQLDGILHQFPVWDNVCTFDGKPWRGKVDVISGGFPCQDISSAGKGTGITGKRSGLWKEMARIIGEVRPEYAFLENSPLLVGRGLTTVLSDLAEEGYDAKWCIIGGKNVGGPSDGKRVWILATKTNGVRPHEMATVYASEYIKTDIWMSCKFNAILSNQKIWESAKRGNDQLCDGLASYVDESKASGNGQIPCVAALAWQILNNE